jgi:hypothetical protein
MRDGQAVEERHGRNRIVVSGVSQPLLMLAGLESSMFQVTHWAWGAGDPLWGGGSPPPSATVPTGLTQLVDETFRTALDFPPPAPTAVLRRFIREIPIEAGEVSSGTSIATEIHSTTRFEPDGWWNGATIWYDAGAGFVSDTVVSYAAPDPGAGTDAIFTLLNGAAGLVGGGDPYYIDPQIQLLGSRAEAGTTTTVIVDSTRTDPTGTFDGEYLEVEVSPASFVGSIVTTYVNPGPSGLPEFTLASVVPGLTEFTPYRLPGFDISNQVEFITVIGPGPSVGYDLREHGLVIRGTGVLNTGVLLNSIRHSPIFFDSGVRIERRLVLEQPFT